MMILDKKYLKDLAAGASYITERKDTSNYQCRESRESEKRRKIWEENVGSENFGKLLRHEHLTAAEALCICGEVVYIGDSLPEWEKTLMEVASYLPVSGEELKNACYADPAMSPFVIYLQDCFLIYAYYAQQKLKGIESVFTENALNSLFQGLVDRLTTIGISAIQKYSIRIAAGEEAETSDLTPAERMKVQPYRILLSGAYTKLWKEFPVLARLMCENTEMWISWIAEFTERVTEDFGMSDRICGVKANISDPHAGGKSALIAEFENGRKVVYKPHSLDMDLAWKNFCLQVNRMPGLRLSFAKADLKENYGYVDFISYESVSGKAQVRQFFENAGMLLCAMYLLGSCDMHYENLIENKEALYVIDTETILQPAGQKRSVKKSGMIRQYMEYSGKTIDDFGGITNKKENTDNLPVIEGKFYSAEDYPESVCKGFRSFYDGMMKACFKNPFSSCSPRYVLRNTNTYALLLKEMSTSYFLRDGFLYSCEVEKFSKACINQYYEIYKSERKALLKMDIPVFYHEKNTRDLYDHAGGIVTDFFESIPSESFQLDFLSEKDRDFQLDEICNILSQKKSEITEMDEIFFDRMINDRGEPDE